MIGTYHSGYAIDDKDRSSSRVSYTTGQILCDKLGQFFCLLYKMLIPFVVLNSLVIMIAKLGSYLKA